MSDGQVTTKSGLLDRLIEPKHQIPQERKRFSNQGLWALIFPIIVEQFLALLVGIADTLMVSYVGEAAVSSVSLVNQLNNVFIMVFTALASGGAVVASQYIGSRDKENGNQAASQLVMITGLISLITTVVVLVLGRQIFGLLFGKVEADMLESGLVYLRISAYSFPALAMYNACAGLFRSMGKTKVLMKVSIIMNAINVVGNAVGVFVLHAGVAGVAYPSLISRVFAAVVMLVLAVDKDNPVTVSARQVFAWKSGMVSRIFHIAIPNSVENGLFQIAKVALSSIVAMFGTVQIAANGVAQSFWSMSALFCPVGFSVSNGMRAAGDVKFTMYASIFSTVVCRTALSVLFGVTLNMGVVGITLAMVCDWAIKAFLIAMRWRSGRWKEFRVI